MSLAKPEKFILQVPFSGFYDSLYSEAIDHEGEAYAECREDNEPEDEPDENLRLDKDEFHEIIFDSMNYRDAYTSVAKSYVSALNVCLADIADLPIALTFESMSSPKYYNFETDRIFAEISRRDLTKLIRAVRRDRYASLRKVIKDRHTSYSGFCSFYNNDIAKWLAKPVSTWDHNELCTLLIAAVLARVGDEEESKDFWNWRIYETCADCDGFYHEWESGMDWEAFDAAVIAKRNEKAEALRGESTGAIPANRCDKTAELPI